MGNLRIKLKYRHRVLRSQIWIIANWQGATAEAHQPRATK